MVMFGVWGDFMIDKELEYLYGLERFGIKLGLEVMQELMERLGHPEKSFKSIHIAGTNGKGSTAAFVASALRKAGYNVGLYTSPHLIRFNERIQVNGEEITDRELIYFIELVRKKIENAQDKLQATFFEFATAIAFLYFAHKKVDIAVIEVGMGGRLDATNVITPEVCVITNIGFDHEEHLGSGLLEIAREKAGIIKKHVPVVTAERNKEVLDYFRDVCKGKESELFVVQEHLKANGVAESLGGQEFAVNGAIEGRFSIRLLGEHQVENACCALLALKLLGLCGINIHKVAMQEGLSAAEWDGRLQIISRKPLVIVDGAHNAAGIEALCNFVKRFENRKVLVIGIAKDKRIGEMVKLIAPLFEKVIVTKGSFKPAETSVIAEEARKYCDDVKEIEDVNEAIEAAFGFAEKGDTILVTGSLYMVGDALAVLKKKALVVD